MANKFYRTTFNERGAKAFSGNMLQLGNQEVGHQEFLEITKQENFNH